MLLPNFDGPLALSLRYFSRDIGVRQRETVASISSEGNFYIRLASEYSLPGIV